ncbi:MAG: protein kinase [Deltaproteobacteria bacterium]|nr:MAG: protein kinase [Deltaproteobacteria bacterium]
MGEDGRPFEGKSAHDEERGRAARGDPALDATAAAPSDTGARDPALDATAAAASDAGGDPALDATAAAASDTGSDPALDATAAAASDARDPALDATAAAASGARDPALDATVAAASDAGAAGAGALASGSGAPAALAPGAPLAPGTRVDRYIVQAPLGAGGMGEVYRARDPDLDREVAIKVMRAAPGGSSGTTGDQRRLVREAQAMAKVRHPNVVTVYDVGTVGDRVFVAMELVRGGTLEQWLRAEPRSWREICDAFAQAGRGLAAAHRAGLIHRDFKPHNVLVDTDGRFRVTDFGLARPATAPEPAAAPGARRASPVDVTLTATGALSGTPAYMAPEQHAGEPLDPRTDQFSFCAALYRALFGVLPFEGDTVPAIAEAVTAGRIRPPPRGARVPRWLARAVLRGLRRDPSERFASMDELLAVLDRHRRPRLRRWAPAIAAATVAGAAAVWWLGPGGPAPCAGARDRLRGVWDADARAAARAAFERAGGAAPAWRAIEAGLDRYAEAWVEAHTDACEATRVRGDQSEALLDLRMLCLERRRGELAALVDMVRNADAAMVQAAPAAVEKLSPPSACADRAALTASPPLPDDPKARAAIEAAEALVSQAAAAKAAGRYRQAVDVAARAVQAARATGWKPVEAEALFELGEAHDYAGSFRDAVDELTAAYAAAQASHLGRLAARAALALAWVEGMSQGRLDEGRRWLEIAEAGVEAAGRPDELYERALGYRAALLQEQGNAAGAIELQRELVDRRRPRRDTDPVSYGKTLHNLGNALYLHGDFAEAADAHRQARDVLSQALGPEHPLLGTVRNSLGSDYWRMGQLDDARREFEAALPILRAAFGDDHPVTADTFQNLSNVALDQGDVATARQYAQRALEVRERSLGPDSTAAGQAHLALGGVEIADGNAVAAEAHYTRALGIFEAALGADHPDVAYPLSGLSEAREARGDIAGALEATERALALRRTSGLRDPQLAGNLFRVARLRVRAGKPRAEAVALAREALAIYRAAPGNYAAQIAEIESWLAAAGAR